MINKGINKGIILAGGSGTRLYPITQVVSKQLMPVYNKPMVYYPLTTLMLAGIRQVLVITLPEEKGLFQNLLQDGSQLGIRIEYAVQARPRGIADALLIAREFIGDDGCALVLGDNIHFGLGLGEKLRRAAEKTSGATVFAFRVPDPQNYGVAEVDQFNKVISLEEKPTAPRSDLAVTGLYFYDNKAAEYASSLQPSQRGELEITDVNKCYLSKGDLSLELLGSGYTWLDTGTHDSLLSAANFVQTMEEKQGVFVGCPEAIALNFGWIEKAQLLQIIEKLKNNNYAKHLQKLTAGVI